MSLELAKGVTLDMNKGVVKLEAKVGTLLAPQVAKLKADIESGKIDPIPGTDMDKVALLQLVDFMVRELGLEA